MTDAPNQKRKFRDAIDSKVFAIAFTPTQTRSPIPGQLWVREYSAPTQFDTDVHISRGGSDRSPFRLHGHNALLCGKVRGYGTHVLLERHVSGNSDTEWCSRGNPGGVARTCAAASRMIAVHALRCSRARCLHAAVTYAAVPRTRERAGHRHVCAFRCHYCPGNALLTFIRPFTVKDFRQ